MPKMSLDWHKKCLENTIKTLQGEKDFINRQLERLAIMEKKAEFYKKQIEEAERKNKDGFDQDKFLKTYRSRRIDGV